MSTGKLRLAEKILNDYCQVIQLTDTSLYGMPQSLLQYSKPQIKQAILTALADLHLEEVDFRESLIHSYLHLAQFIPDELAETTHRGQQAILSGDINHPDMSLGEEAIKIINGIKNADVSQYMESVVLDDFDNKFRSSIKVPELYPPSPEPQTVLEPKEGGLVIFTFDLLVYMVEEMRQHYYIDPFLEEFVEELKKDPSE